MKIDYLLYLQFHGLTLEESKKLIAEFNMFKIKHIKSFLVNVFTKNKYCVCESCNKIYKSRNVVISDRYKDIPLDNNWYYGICIDCFSKMESAGQDAKRREI